MVRRRMLKINPNWCNAGTYVNVILWTRSILVTSLVGPKAQRGLQGK